MKTPRYIDADELISILQQKFDAVMFEGDILLDTKLMAKASGYATAIAVIKELAEDELEIHRKIGAESS